MDSDAFSCMQSLQASTADRDRYNKSICANLTVKKISPAPSVTMPITQLSISKPRPSHKEKIQPLTLMEPNSDPGF